MALPQNAKGPAQVYPSRIQIVYVVDQDFTDQSSGDTAQGTDLMKMEVVSDKKLATDHMAWW